MLNYCEREFKVRYRYCIFYVGLVLRCVSASLDSTKENQIITDVGTNISLSCFQKELILHNIPVYWEREGRSHSGEQVLDDGSLLLINLSREDTGQYKCLGADDNLFSRVHLFVRGPPFTPYNVNATPLVGGLQVFWEERLELKWQEAMGGAITSIFLRYRPLTDNHWQEVPDHLPPSQEKANVYSLQPNTTYEIQLWAENKFGKSDFVSVFATTLPLTQEMELSQQMYMTLDSEGPRKWFVGILAVLLVINVFGAVTLIVFCRSANAASHAVLDEYSENIELVANVIENPNYSFNSDDTHSLPHSHDSQSTTSLNNPVVV